MDKYYIDVEIEIDIKISLGLNIDILYWICMEDPNTNNINDISSID